MASRDVHATWDLEMQAIEFARRVGRRDSELTVIGNAGEDAVRLGDWDWIRGEMRRSTTSTFRWSTASVDFSDLVIRRLR